MKLYIAVLDDVPDVIVPTLVAHTMLGAHIAYSEHYIYYGPLIVGNPYEKYIEWLENSFKKCVCRVNKKEFDKIANIPYTYLGHENKTLGGKKSCAIPLPSEDIPNVLKFAKLWSPK